MLSRHSPQGLQPGHDRVVPNHEAVQGDHRLTLAESACRFARRRCLQLLLERGWLDAHVSSLPHMLFECSKAPVVPQLPPLTEWLVEHLTGESVPEARRHELTAEVLETAAHSGQLRVLQLLRERGCPWDEIEWEGAAEGGCEAVLDWLHDAGCPKRVGGASVTVAASMLQQELCRQTLMYCLARYRSAFLHARACA
jgi:hypothetical protein